MILKGVLNKRTYPVMMGLKNLRGGIIIMFPLKQNKSPKPDFLESEVALSDKQNEWSEDDSALYAHIAPVAVPARAEQTATVLSLIPFAPDEAFRAVELASGEGACSVALLAAFPKASLVALDGSEQMLAKTRQRLQPFGKRVQVGTFDLFKTDWLAGLETVDCFFSSLCVHHLNKSGKRALFKALCDKLSPRGALLIADLVEPQRAEARTLFADSWDFYTKKQALELTGSPELFEKFEKAHWNYYRHPDPYDTPSPLFDQLLWLREAGFAVADCFWMQAAHAVYGGYKSREQTPKTSLGFEAALDAARRALAPL